MSNEVGMGKFEKFEEILAWQKGRELVGDVYEVTAGSNFPRDFGLRDHIRRASVSIMLNIAEGFARRTNKEFSQFLFIAHGSVAEVQSALCIALDQKYISRESFEKLYSHCSEVPRMISGLIKYLCSTWTPETSQTLQTRLEGHHGKTPTSYQFQILD